MSGPVASKLQCTSACQQTQASRSNSLAPPWFLQESRAANPNAVTTPNGLGISQLCLAATSPMQRFVHHCTPAGWTSLLTSPALPPQDRPRRLLPSFTSPHPECRELGFLLERGRCTATAQAEGRLKMAWKIPDSRATFASQTSYTMVQPGLQCGSMYFELLIQSTCPSSKGFSGLKFWAVSMGCRPAQHRVKIRVHTCCSFWRPWDCTCAKVTELRLAGWEQPQMGQRDSVCQPAPQDHILVCNAAAGTALSLCSSNLCACLIFAEFKAFGSKSS